MIRPDGRPTANVHQSISRRGRGGSCAVRSPPIYPHRYPSRAERSTATEDNLLRSGIDRMTITIERNSTTDIKTSQPTWDSVGTTNTSVETRTGMSLQDSQLLLQQLGGYDTSISIEHYLFTNPHPLLNTSMFDFPFDRSSVLIGMARNDSVNLVIGNEANLDTHLLSGTSLRSSQNHAECNCSGPCNSNKQCAAKAPTMSIVASNQRSYSMFTSITPSPSCSGSSPGSATQPSPPSCCAHQTPPMPSPPPSPHSPITPSSFTSTNWPFAVMESEHAYHRIGSIQERDPRYPDYDVQPQNTNNAINETNGTNDHLSGSKRIVTGVSTVVVRKDHHSLNRTDFSAYCPPLDPIVNRTDRYPLDVHDTNIGRPRLPRKKNCRKPATTNIKKEEYLPAHCPECSKIYRGQWAKSNLARHHLQKHNGPVKTFCCRCCWKIFFRSDALLKHERKKHRNVSVGRT